MEVTNQRFGLTFPEATTTDEGSSELPKRLVNQNLWLVTSSRNTLQLPALAGADRWPISSYKGSASLCQIRATHIPMLKHKGKWVDRNTSA